MADYKKIIPFIKRKEGGLSRRQTDSASKHPSPCTYKGVKGWHTNKGITWTTFVTQSHKLNYSASCSNFLTMPDEIWGKIFKQAYWDKFYLDEMKSQPIADLIVGFAWGSGVYGAKKQLIKFLYNNYDINVTTNKEITQTINKLTKTKKKEIILLNKLIEHKKNYLISLNQPANIRGWLKRLEDYKDYAIQHIGAKRLMGMFVGGMILTFTGITLLILKGGSGNEKTKS